MDFLHPDFPQASETIDTQNVKYYNYRYVSVKQ